MAALPPRSPGVLAAGLDDGAVLYDLVAEVVHVLNPSATVVWAACDGSTTTGALVAEIVAATGSAGDAVTADVERAVRTLVDAGLVGRSDPAPVPADLRTPAAPGRHRSTALRVLDDAVVVRSDDPSLVEAVDGLLGSLATTAAASVVLGATPTDDGAVQLTGLGPTITHPSAVAALEFLPSALNQVAAATRTCLALHAACVRSPQGEVVLLPGRSGAGKSTLAAALVQAGWSYGSDEAVGVRAGSLQAVTYPKPLVLDAASRGLLGLPTSGSVNLRPGDLGAELLLPDVAAVDRVVLPRHAPGEPAVLADPLAPGDAATAVIEHALNLARVGTPGLEAACQLATRTPVQRLVHDDLAAAVALLGR